MTPTAGSFEVLGHAVAGASVVMVPARTLSKQELQ